ncbi:hypothetical protein [Nocardia suismassiliense]|uniref:hypothetical protein n=1 Tax=Nocardia suismassiliense TaxID=2077092 RepID=UPI000D1F937A|nr:hypothetical protein [Nocardia suismassiliense]
MTPAKPSSESESISAPTESATASAGLLSTALATALTAEQLTQLREQARHRDCRFVDPSQLRRVAAFTAGRSAWASAVLGTPFTGARAATLQELTLLDLAAAAEPEPPVPPRRPDIPTPQEQAAAARARAADEAWLRLAAALPVPVTVAYNYSGPLHLENYVSGADHILPTEPVSIGRLRRSERSSLCCTPSRSRKLLFDQRDPPDKRTPTCKACLRTAYRIAGCPPDPALMGMTAKQTTSHPTPHAPATLTPTGTPSPHV